MNEDVFNTSIRKFLKTLGVTAQREIEKAVRQALADGKLKGNEKLAAQATCHHRNFAVPPRDQRDDRARLAAPLKEKGRG